MEVNATTQPREDLSIAQNRAFNTDFAFVATNYMLNRAPDYYVYVYNISEMTFELSRPPMFKFIKIVPNNEATRQTEVLNQEGERISGYPKELRGEKKYVLAAAFPQPLLIPKGNVESNELDIIPNDARRFAMDLINPENLGLNQDAVLDPTKIMSQGTDLGRRGLFWSLNGPGASKHGHLEKPSDEEVKRAYERLGKHYRYILEQADAVEAARPGDLVTYLTPEHHAACEYYGEDRKWHNKKVRTEVCDNCGERIKEGAAFHKTTDGGKCINDWSRAVKAGFVTRSEAFEATEDPQFAPKVPKTPKTSGD